MNKKILLSILCILLVAIPTAYAAIPDSAKLVVSLISQDPDPANPGEVIDLRFKVENEGGGPTEDILFEFKEEYPFTVYTGKQQQNIGSLQAIQNEEEGVIVLYKIKVDENAVQGTFYVDIKYKVNNIWYTVKDFAIRIRTRDVILSIDEIKTTPGPVPPGEDFELALDLKNNADSIIRDITISLDLSDDDIPIAPSSSTAVNQIYQISSKGMKTMRFNLLALPDADGGVYKIPINVSYTDETGETYTKDDYISISISSAPDLLVNIDSTQVKGEVKSGEVVIKITNRGLTDIKLLSAKMTENEDISVLSESELYVGNIDSDDYETVDFKISVKSYEKQVTLPLEIKYRDSTNKEFTQEIDLTLKTNSLTKAQTTVKSIISGIFTLIIIVIVGLVIYKIYKKIRKKKKRQG